MPSDDEWRSMIREANDGKPAPVNAMEYRKNPQVTTFASPPLLACDDGEEYWVKHPRRNEGCPPGQRTHHLGGMATDHIVASLAMKMAIEAVPRTAIVIISPGLISMENRLSNSCPGPAHGSRNVSANCTGRSEFTHGGYHALPINRSRVASLAVLYGLAMASDRQVIFSLGGDPLIFSVDHGHFLHCGPNWNEASFSSAPRAEIDPSIIRDCGLTAAELSEPLRVLRSLAANDVAEAVAAPPDEWLVTESDRIALARYLWTRREQILAAA